MAITIHSSTPAAVTNANDPWTTASFNPPNNSLLVILVSADWFGGTPTITLTDSLSQLTFTQRQSNGAINQGIAQIYTAEVGSNGGSRTISGGTTITDDSGGIKVFVLEGQHSTGYYDTSTGATGSTTNDIDGVITTGFDGCWVFGVGTDWQNLGLTTSYDVHENGAPGGIAPVFVRKSMELPEAGKEHINFNAATLTSAPTWSWAAISIRPASYTKPTAFKKSQQARLQNLTAQTSTAVDMPNAGDIQTGNYLVARLALDNTGASGAATTVSVTDPRSNSWTVGTAALQDPGAASAGIQGNIAYCKVVNAYTNGDDITFNYGNSTTAKAIVIEELKGVHATTPVAVAQTTANGATGTPSISRTPTAASQLFYGLLAVEAGDTDTYTEDTDTTDGPWLRLPGISTTSGTVASNAMVRGVMKIVTDTSAQTWNPTITARDWAQAALVFDIAASTVPVDVTESNSLAASDESAITNVISVSDGGSIAVSETTATTAGISVTESNSLAADDVSTNDLTSSVSESNSLAVSEATAVTASFSATESNSLAVSEVATVTVAIDVSESNSLAVSESATTDVFLTVTESNSLAVSETVELHKAIEVTESNSLAVSEAATVTVAISVSDSAALSASESVELNVSVSVAESNSLAVTEATQSALATTVTESNSLAVSETADAGILNEVSASDSMSLAVSESVSVDISVPVTESNSLAVSETAALDAASSRTESNSLAVSETATVGRESTSTESNSLAVSETATILVTISVSDGTAISVSEQQTSAVSTTVADGAAVSVSDVASKEESETKNVSQSHALSVSDVATVTTISITVKGYHNGTFKTATAVKVYRSGAFVTADVNYRTGGAWT